MNIEKQTIEGGTVQNIGHIENYYGSVSFQKYISSVLFSAEQSGKSYYYYRSGLLPFYGRTEEIKILKRFLEDEAAFSIIAVTGNGGSGKSRLIYEFLKHTSDWDRAYLDWQEFSLNSLNHSIYSFAYEKDLILVLDYVLGYADEIGDWLYKIKNHSSTYTNKIRIIIIEREEVLYQRQTGAPMPYRGIKASPSPYWFSKIIEKHRLEEHLYAVIELRPLLNIHLMQIARALIWKETHREVSDTLLLENIIRPLERIDAEKKRPIFLLYITNAWLKNKDVRNWDIQELLRWIDNNESKRIYALAGHDTDITAAIMCMLCYATMISGMDAKKVPDFMASDWTKIVNYAQRQGTNVRKLFNEINLESHDKIYLEPLVPDLMGEYFCLHFLTESILDNGGEGLILQFAKSAIEAGCNEYAAFLIRISQDFPDMEMEELGSLLCACGSKSIDAVLYGEFLYKLTSNINNPRFQVMFDQVFQANGWPEVAAYQNARVENLTYLAIFPFDFPGIKNDREQYMGELRKIKYGHPRFWPQYAMALSYLIEREVDEERKRQYLEEVRSHLRDYDDPETAFYFANMLLYFLKTEHNIEYYLELQELTAAYQDNHKIASFYMLFLEKELRGRGYSSRSYRNECLYYAQESFEFMTLLAGRYISDEMIRDAYLAFWGMVKQYGSDQLKKQCCECFTVGFRHGCVYSPRIAAIYCEALKIRIDFSENADQRKSILLRMLEVLYKCEAGGSNARSRSFQSSARNFKGALDTSLKRLSSQEARCRLVDILASAALEMKGRSGSVILEALSSVLTSEFFGRTRFLSAWRKTMQYRIYEQIPREEFLTRYLEAAADTFAHLPRPERVLCIGKLLEWIKGQGMVWSHGLILSMYCKLMEVYISPEYLGTVRHMKPSELELPTGGSEFTLEFLFSLSWSIQWQCTDYEIMKMSRRILKYHYQRELLLKYQEWLYQRMEEGKADETLVNELGRLYYTYGGNTSAFFWAKGMDTLLDRTDIHQMRMKYLVKINRLRMRTDAPGLAELYCRALRKAIEKDCGKQRNRLLKQFNFMMQEEREVFSKEIYVELLWNLADRYYNGAHRNYLNEIVMQIKDDAPLTVYCGKIMTKLLGEQSLHLQTCLKVYDALKENQVKSRLVEGILLFLAEFDKNFVSEKAACDKMSFLLHMMQDMVDCGISIKLSDLYIISGAVTRLLYETMRENRLWKGAKYCVNEHCIFLQAFCSRETVREIIRSLIFSIDIFQNMDIRKDYYWYLYRVSQEYCITLSTGLEGQLIAENAQFRIISSKPVTSKLLYPEDIRPWLMAHLPDGW